MLMMATFDTGTLGAALMGLVAAGIEADMGEAAGRWVKVATQVDPQPGTQARLDTLYAVYREAYDALVPIFPGLAAVADQAVDTS